MDAFLRYRWAWGFPLGHIPRSSACFGLVVAGLAEAGSEKFSFQWVGTASPGRPVGFEQQASDAYGRPGGSSLPLYLLVGLSEKWCQRAQHVPPYALPNPNISYSNEENLWVTEDHRALRQAHGLERSRNGSDTEPTEIKTTIQGAKCSVSKR